MKNYYGTVKKHILLILAVMMAVSLVATGNYAKADSSERKLLDVTENGCFSGNFHINGVDLAEVETANYGDTLVAQINWEFSDEMKISADDVLIYDLPKNIQFSESNGNILSEAEEVLGSYKIENNQIQIQYSNSEFLSKLSRKGKLSFQGKLQSDDISQTEPTPLTVKFEGIGEYSFTVIPPEVLPEVAITKKFSDYNYQEHIYDCVEVVTAVGNHSGVRIADEMYPGMELYGDAPKIYTDEDCSVLYTGSYTGFEEESGATVLNAIIAEMSDGDKLYIKYQVTVQPDLYARETVNKYFDTVSRYAHYYPLGYEGRVPSDVCICSNEMPNKKTVWADIYTLSAQFYKWPLTTELLKEGKICWQIQVNKIDSSVTSGWVIDSFPENTQILTNENQVSLTDKSNNKLTPLSDYITFEQIDDTTLKMVFSDKLLDVLKKSGMKFTYYTKVTKQTQATQYYRNKAELFLSGVSYGVSGNNQQFTKPEELNKTCEYNEATAPYANYTIKINPASLDLNPDGNDILLQDIMGNALDLEISSIKINGETPKAGTVKFDSANRKLQISLQDNTAYEITYQTYINLKTGETLDASNASNSCELVGLNITGGETPTVINAVVFSSAASSSAEEREETAELKLVKHDSENIMVGLSGAKFKLEKITLDSMQEKVIAREDVNTNLVTNESGVLSMKNLERDVVYCITETQAPMGYLLDSNSIYFVFKGKSGVTYPSQFMAGRDSVKLTAYAASKVKDTVYVSNTKEEEAEEPPVTESPVTEPPVTEPPVTEPPVTEPPVTELPVTEPPVTEPPATEVTSTEPPATAVPEKDSVVTAVPEKNPVVTAVPEKDSSTEEVSEVEVPETVVIETTPETETKTNTKAVKTGDEVPIGRVAIVFVISVIILYVVGRKRFFDKQ